MVSAVKTLEGKVFLATSCSPEAEPKAAPEFPFYRALAKAIEQIEIGTFLPHRDIPKDASLQDVYSTNQRVIGESNLVLADIGAPSMGAGIMIGMAYTSSIPIIPFHRISYTPERRVLEKTTVLYPPITVTSDEQGIREIVDAVRKAYGK